MHPNSRIVNYRTHQAKSVRPGCVCDLEIAYREMTYTGAHGKLLFHQLIGGHAETLLH